MSRFLPTLTTPGEHHTERKQNQNRKWIGKKKHFFILCHHTFENPFLLPFFITLSLSPSSPQWQPRHHNIDNFLWHYIIVNIFLWNKILRNPFHPDPSLLFLINSLKSISTFKTKSLMKPDTFDFKSLPAFLLQLYPWHHLIISPHMLLNRKTQTTVSVWRSSVEIKP